MRNNEFNANKILFRLIVNTRKNGLLWTENKKTKEITKYTHYEKITNKKHIIYELIINHNDPTISYMKVYFSIFISDKVSKNTLIGDIDYTTRIMFLYKEILVSRGVNVITSVVGVYEEDDDILLLKRHEYDNTIPNIYVLPGGKVDDDENRGESLIREFKEETGLTVIDFDKTQYTNVTKIGVNYYYIICYVIYQVKGELHKFPTKEIKSHLFVDKYDIFNMHIGKETNRILSYYIKNY